MKNNVSARAITLQVEHTNKNSPAAFKCKEVKKERFDFEAYNTMLESQRGLLDYFLNKPGKINIVLKPQVNADLIESSKPLNSKESGKFLVSLSNSSRSKNEWVGIVEQITPKPVVDTRHFSIAPPGDFYALQLEPLPFQGSLAFSVFACSL